MTNQIQAKSNWAVNILAVGAVLVAVLILPYFAMLGFRAAASSLPAYVLCGVAGIGLTIWASRKISAGKAGRLAFISIGITVFFWLLLLPYKYSNYQQPARPASGYQLQWVTQPSTGLTDAFKQFQYAFEIQCDYGLLGWTEVGNLQYTLTCMPGVWTYSPATQTSTWALFNFSTPINAVMRWDGQQYPDYPTSLSKNDFSLTLERVIAPNRQWEAVVVRWFYGPSDIVIVGKLK